MTKTMSKDAMLQEYTKVMEKKYWNPNRQDNLNQQSVFYQLHPEWQLYDTRSAIAYRIAHDLNFANTKWIEDLQKDIKNLKNQYCGITVYYNGNESQYYEGELPLNMKQFNDIRPVLDNAYQTLSEMQANHVDSWETNYQGEVSSKDFTTLDYAEIEDDIKHCQEQYKEKAIEVDEERKNNGTKYYTLDGKLKIFTLFDSCQKDDIDIKTIDGISAVYHEFDERGFPGNYVRVRIDSEQISHLYKKYEEKNVNGREYSVKDVSEFSLDKFKEFEQKKSEQDKGIDSPEHETGVKSKPSNMYDENDGDHDAI